MTTFHKLTGELAGSQPKDASLTHAAWQVPETEFAALTDVEARWRFLLQYAVLAPSNHNSQPWLWEVEGAALKLYADRSRALPVTDPDDRQLIISCGAALLHLRIAMAHFGYQAHIETFGPQVPYHGTQSHDLLAVIRFGEKATATAEEETLFYAMPRRHTNRSPFEPRPVPEVLLRVLEEEAAAEGAWLQFITTEADRAALIQLVMQGDSILWKDPHVRHEWANWIHPNHSAKLDGIPGYALGLGDMASCLAPTTMKYWNGTHTTERRDVALAESAPAIAVLGTDVETPVQWLATGAALSRVLLRACAAGVDVSFFNQPIEEWSLWAQLRHVLGRGGFPQLMFRLGYATQPTPPTPRRTPTEVLK